MIEPITQDRWQEAQATEISVVSYDRENSRRASQYIFDYLGIAEDRGGQCIIEIGCGPYPATDFVVNVEPILVEPLYFQQLEEMIGIQWIREAFEDAPLENGDEVWLFNALQHVRDPELVIAKAKKIAPVIRFFEPVDYPTCVYHPHTFSQQDFERWFGSCVKRYTDRKPGFFDADCVYGTWKCLAS